MVSRWTAALVRHRIPLASVFVLATLTLVIFWPALGHQFLINWDDPGYVVDNEMVHGLSFAHVARAFTSFHLANYAPLTLLSYMVDFSLWGMNATGFVWTNLLLHCGNGILVYFVCARLAPNRLWPLAAAMLFLLHPVQVESVVWISQRKTLLAMLLFLVALLAYVHRRQGDPARARTWYAVALTSFALALLAKASVIVLPLLLVGVELFFPEPIPLGRRLRPTLPFFAVAGLAAVVTVVAQRGGGLTEGYHGGGAVPMLLTMLPILFMYVRMVIWPKGLSAWYDPPIRTEFDVITVLSLVVVGLLLGLGVWLFVRHRQRCFWYGWFFVGLLPVSQLVPTLTLINDRYLYLPMVGASAFLAAMVLGESPAEGRPDLRLVARLAALAAVLVLATDGTRARIPVWHDAGTLWSDAATKTPSAPLPLGALGFVALHNGQLDAAAELLQTAISLATERASAPGGDRVYLRYLLNHRTNLAVVYEHQGKFEAAELELRQVLATQPDFAMARKNLDALLRQRGAVEAPPAVLPDGSR